MRVVTHGSACCTLSQYTFHGSPIGCAASPSSQTRSNSPGFTTDHKSFYVVTFSLTRSLFLCLPHSLPHQVARSTRQQHGQMELQFARTPTLALSLSLADTLVEASQTCGLGATNIHVRQRHPSSRFCISGKLQPLLEPQKLPRGEHEKSAPICSEYPAQWRGL